MRKRRWRHERKRRRRKSYIEAGNLRTSRGRNEKGSVCDEGERTRRISTRKKEQERREVRDGNGRKRIKVGNGVAKAKKITQVKVQERRQMRKEVKENECVEKREKKNGLVNQRKRGEERRISQGD